VPVTADRERVLTGTNTTPKYTIQVRARVGGAWQSWTELVVPPR